MSVVIKEIETKGVMTKSNLPVSDYSVNPYVGCVHGCKYCYASFMKRFTNHPEPWGDFVDVKYWTPIKNPKKYVGKEAFIGSVTDPYQPCEKEYCRTRELLEQLQGSPFGFSAERFGFDQNLPERARIVVDQYAGRGLPQADGQSRQH